LLDESIQHRRDTELSHPSVRLGDFHPPYRLRLVGSSSLLRAIRLEVVGREQENDCHRLAEIFEIGRPGKFTRAHANPAYARA
jgi:hypothetical protein